MIHTCKQCNKEFKERGNRKRICCSRSCDFKYRIRTDITGKLRTGGKKNKGKHHSEETKKKISLLGKGRKLSEETKIKMSESRKGNRHWNWKGGVSSVNSVIRHSREYKLWRKAVFERDNFTCVWCGVKGVRLNADHIKPFAYYPELRFAIDNGRTLCEPCHETTDTFKAKARWNR